MRNKELLILLAWLIVFPMCLFAQTKEKIIKVACVGNSITEGYALKHPETESYPAVLQHLLGNGYEVGNFGLSAHTLMMKGNLPYMSKQRYQDFAYKIGVRRAFEHLISIGILSPEDDITLHFFVDEHHTATNGRYELEEALLQEFKEGTYNFNFMKYYKPLFPNMRNLHLKMEDSTQSLLIRAADIVANRLYYEKERGSIRNLRGHNVYITRLP